MGRRRGASGKRSAQGARTLALVRVGPTLAEREREQRQEAGSAQHVSD